MTLNLPRYFSGRTRILAHVLFWLLYWLYHALLYGSYEQDYMLQFKSEGMYLPVKMAATYGTLYVLLPRYFLNRKYAQFALALTATLVVAAILQRGLDYAVVYRILDLELSHQPFWTATPILKIILGIYPVVALAAFIKLAKHWYERDLLTQELEREKLEAELKFLKAQIHPHFLFNTLNNLYALTLKRSEQAAEVVLMLSDLINYMLYEGNHRTVALHKELDVVETYIRLEKIRRGDRMEVSYRVEGETEGIMIPPMLIMPFIENAFKHGAGGDPEQSWVDIGVEVTEDRFTLTVANSKTDDESPAVRAKPHTEGIGLRNVTRRLELLYGDRHELYLDDDGNTFTATLKLDLRSTLRPEAT